MTLGASEGFLQGLNRILKDGRVLVRLKRKTSEGDYDCQTRLSREPHGETDTVLGSRDEITQTLSLLVLLALTRTWPFLG